jgi:hypothetical protein
VLLDEAHAARRANQIEGEFNSPTLLLGLLRRLQASSQAKGFVLLSATPMQTHPWEPWDLLQVLGEGGVWLSGFHVVRHYYQGLAAVERGVCTKADSAVIATTLSHGPAASCAEWDQAATTIRRRRGVRQSADFPACR